MTTVRLACGATVAAARESLHTRAPALNLLGGFHHAGPSSAGGLLPGERRGGGRGRAPGGGFRRARGGARPGRAPARRHRRLPGRRRQRVDRLALRLGLGSAPRRGRDRAAGGDHRRAGTARRWGRCSRACPARSWPSCWPGGDVLAGDRMGRLGLTLAGARERDLAVAMELEGIPSVWLPGGGYSRLSWRALAGTGMAVAAGSQEPIPDRYDPLSARFAVVSRQLSPSDLSESGELTAEDLEEALGIPAPAAAPPARVLHGVGDGARALPLRGLRAAGADGVPAVPGRLRHRRAGRAHAPLRRGRRPRAPPGRDHPREAAHRRGGRALRALDVAAQPARTVQRAPAAAARARRCPGWAWRARRAR